MSDRVPKVGSAHVSRILLYAEQRELIVHSQFDALLNQERRKEKLT